MTEQDTTTATSERPPVVAAPAPPAPAPAAPPPAAAAPPPQTAPPEAPRSKSWLAFVALFVVVALLAGATAALFVRVRDAQQTADDAVVLAGNQDALTARIDELDATLASVESSGTANADDLDAARDQVSALRKCVNKAIESWAEATQSGEATAITKC